MAQLHSSTQAAVEYFLPPKNAQLLLRSLESSAHQLRIFLIGSIILILTASVDIGKLSVATRTADTKSLPNFEEFVSAGFSLKDGALRCFHCGCRADPCTARPLQQHRLNSPNCFLQRLLSLVAGEANTGSSDVSVDSRRYERALRRLQKLLNEASLLQFVEKFGFSKNATAFGAVRFFMTRDGRWPDTPGALIQLLHETDDVAEVAEVVDVIELIRLALGDASACAQQSQQPRNPNSNPNSKPKPKPSRAESDGMGGATVRQNSGLHAAASDGVNTPSETTERHDGPECEKCRRQPRNRVLLPCRHLRFCNQCADGLQVCPACKTPILGEVAVYLS